MFQNQGIGETVLGGINLSFFSSMENAYYWMLIKIGTHFEVYIKREHSADQFLHKNQGNTVFSVTDVSGPKVPFLKSDISKRFS